MEFRFNVQDDLSTLLHDCLEEYGVETTETDPSVLIRELFLQKQAAKEVFLEETE